VLTLCVLYIWRKSTVVYSFRTKLEYEFAKYGAWCISCQNAAHTTCFDIQSTVGDRAFPINGYLRILHVLPLHVTSAPALQTFRRRGWSHFCSVVVSRPIFSFHIIAATLLLAVAVGATHVKATVCHYTGMFCRCRDTGGETLALGLLPTTRRPQYAWLTLVFLTKLCLRRRAIEALEARAPRQYCDCG